MYIFFSYKWVREFDRVYKGVGLGSVFYTTSGREVILSEVCLNL